MLSFIIWALIIFGVFVLIGNAIDGSYYNTKALKEKTEELRLCREKLKILEEKFKNT